MFSRRLESRSSSKSPQKVSSDAIVLESRQYSLVVTRLLKEWYFCFVAGIYSGLSVFRVGWVDLLYSITYSFVLVRCSPAHRGLLMSMISHPFLRIHPLFPLLFRPNYRYVVPSIAGPFFWIFSYTFGEHKTSPPTAEPDYFRAAALKKSVTIAFGLPSGRSRKRAEGIPHQ